MRRRPSRSTSSRVSSRRAEWVRPELRPCSRSDQRDLCGNRQALTKAADRHHRVEAAGVNRRQHLIGSIAGVLLLLLAYGVQQRLRWAWALSAVLLCAGAVSVMLKGFAWEEAIALALLLLGLLPARREFHLSSSPPSQQYAAGWFVAVAVVLTTAWWLGLFS
jgi:lysylphosphatidylglycerol synthetase-like protein (DUF2156 family)